MYYSTIKDVPRSTSTNLHFNIDGIPRKEKIHRAELRLFAESHKSKLSRKKNVVKIYGHNTTQLLHVHKVHQNKLGYVSIDVTSTVNRWINNSINDTTLTVKHDRHDEDVRQSRIIIRQRREVSEVEWYQKRPLLIVYTISSGEKRKLRKRRNGDGAYEEHRRHLEGIHKKARREVCRMRPFFLDFSVVGWDQWILAPSGYAINYCSGDCPKPLVPHYNTTNHAVIQNYVLSLNKNIVPKLCCIPTTLRSQTILYLDKRKLVLKNQAQMIALYCGCR